MEKKWPLRMSGMNFCLKKGSASTRSGLDRVEYGNKIIYINIMQYTTYSTYNAVKINKF